MIDEDDEDVIGYDQDDEPVSSHSAGHPACPAVNGGVCPIDAHNVDECDCGACEACDAAGEALMMDGLADFDHGRAADGMTPFVGDDDD